MHGQYANIRSDDKSVDIFPNFGSFVSLLRTKVLIEFYISLRLTKLTTGLSCKAYPAKPKDALLEDHEHLTGWQ